LELKVIALGSLTVLCGGVDFSVFVSLEAVLFVALLIPKGYWQIVVNKISAMCQLVAGIFRFTLNSLSKFILQIKDFYDKFIRL